MSRLILPRRALLAAPALILPHRLRAQGGMAPGPGTPASAGGGAYTGIADAVGSLPYSYWGLRAMNAAYVAGGAAKAIQVTKASDSTTHVINVLTTGALDVATASGLLSADATATASTSGSSNTVALIGASSTPHFGSTLSGTGVVQPCVVVGVGSFVGGAGNITVSTPQTLTAASLTMTYALWVTTWYDQTTNANDLTSPFGNGPYPTLIFNAIGSLPAIYFVPGGPAESQYRIASYTLVQPFTVSAVFKPVYTINRTNSLVFGDNGTVVSFNIADPTFGFAPGVAENAGGTSFDVQFSGTSGTAIAAVMNAASSNIYINGTSNPAGASVGTAALGAGSKLSVGDLDGGTQGIFMLPELALFPIALNSTQAGAAHTNQSAYYGTP